MTRILAALAAALLTCAPALAQNAGTLPTAQPLTGTERMPAVQGSGCPTKTSPCTTVAITPSAIGTFIGNTFQAKDADLDAIAALTTQPFGRSLLTQADAAAVRSIIGAAIGSNVQAWDADLDALAAVSGTSTIYYRSGSNAWSPVTIGSNLTFSGGTLAAAAGGGGSGTVTGVTGTAPIVSSGGTAPAISITAASASAPGSMSAADKSKLDAISGTNTGDQTSVTGNAGTASKWATARTLSFTGDATGSSSVDGSANVATALTLATVPIAKGGTGDTGTAWSAYTPTVSCGSGTLTTATAVGRYKTIGKTVYVQARLSITTVGSCAAWINLSMPVATYSGGSQDRYALSGQEIGIAGFGLTSTIQAGGTNAYVYRYDGTTPASSGAVLIVTGVYEAG